MREQTRPTSVNRLLIQLGFFLILLGLLTGLAVGQFANPRLGLAAHQVGVLGGLVLVVLGLVSRYLVLGSRAAAVMTWTWIYATYANWFASVLGAVTGASRMTPIAGHATRGGATSEAVVAFLLISLAFAGIVGAALAVWGARNNVRKEE
jgi:hydroxylaminobenzene mutase